MGGLGFDVGKLPPFGLLLVRTLLMLGSKLSSLAPSLF